MSDERFDHIDQKLDRLKTDVRSDLTGLKEHMLVLHEDVIARIAGIQEYKGPKQADFAELKEMIGRRIDPLEATVRHHTREIRRLKQRDGPTGPP